MVSDYGAHGDGVQDDTVHIQNAINAMGTSGGTVVFPTGRYRTTDYISLPVNNQSLLTLSGYGATIVLSGANGFLNFPCPTGTEASVKNFKYLTIEGFDVDGTNRSSNQACWILGCDSAWGKLFVPHGNMEYITLRDIHGYGCPARMNQVVSSGIGIGSKHIRNADPILNSIRHILLENIRIEGGDTGCVMSGQLSGGSVSPPFDMNCDMDDIVVRNFYFDSGKVPPYSGMYGNTGLMIGQHQRGGTLTVTDSFCARTEDDLFEFNSFADVTLTRCVAVESYNLCFTFRNQGPRILGGATAMGNQNLKYIDCHAERGREDNSYQAIGFATLEVDRADIHYTNTHWHKHDGTQVNM